MLADLRLREVRLSRSHFTNSLHERFVLSGLGQSKLPRKIIFKFLQCQSDHYLRRVSRHILILYQAFVLYNSFENTLNFCKQDVLWSVTR
jgi:hypothetical protein